MNKKELIGILGNGNVGGALARGLLRAGYEVQAVGDDPAGVRDTVKRASVILMAVPFGAIDDVITSAGGAGAFAGKTVIDVTNALTSDMSLALGFETSGAEELQKKLAKATVVKAFNTVFAQHMDTGRLGDDRLSAFVASDDADAKTRAMTLARDIGFDAVDAGPLRGARLLEPLGYFNIQLGYVLKMGTQTGFRYLHG